MSGLPEQDELVGILGESVRQVLESFVIDFTETTALEQRPADPPADGAETSLQAAEEVLLDTEASVRFEGSFNGGVVIRCSAPGALAIARSMLMVMDDGEVLEFEEIADALGECANMVGGTVKTRALDPIGSFQMSPPEIQRCGMATPPDGALAYRLNHGFLSAEIWVEGQRAQ